MSAGRAQFVKHLNTTKTHKTTQVCLFREKGFLEMLFAAIGATAPSIRAVSKHSLSLEASSS